MLSRAFWSMVVVCVFLTSESRAQPPDIGPGPGPFSYPNDSPYGPRIGNNATIFAGPIVGYGYPGLGYGGFGYPGYGYGGFGYGGFGYPGFVRYSGRAGSSWSNGLSLYGPPVPVTGSIPGVFGNNDLVNQWRSTLSPGYANYGVAIGISVGGPRYRFPSSPVVEGVATGPLRPVPAAKVGGCLILSVKVPQPAAELFVDGRPTQLKGTDRIYETPPLEAGKPYTYTVKARWIERGVVFESTREVTGTAGEVVRVNFADPVVILTEK